MPSGQLRTRPSPSTKLGQLARDRAIMSAVANEPENLVLELLRGMRADITSVKADVELMRSQMVTKDELASEIRSLRADVASDLLAMQEKNTAEHKATREMVAACGGPSSTSIRRSSGMESCQRTGCANAARRNASELAGDGRPLKQSRHDRTRSGHPQHLSTVRSAGRWKAAVDRSPDGAPSGAIFRYCVATPPKL
jgi:hypothetical protein